VRALPRDIAEVWVVATKGRRAAAMGERGCSRHTKACAEGAQKEM
jgi:hypothetical protein